MPEVAPPRGRAAGGPAEPFQGGRRVGWLLLTAWLTLGSVVPGHAQSTTQATVPASADPVLDARVQAIASELRCLVCQNQTIAESHAGLAVDLRRQVREMLARGESERQVIDYMTARYGDFVLYRPPVKRSTAALWYGPAVLLLIAAISLVVVLRKRSRMPADRFEPDPDEGATGSWVDPRTSPTDAGSPPPTR